jgi:hypothetical protein
MSEKFTLTVNDNPVTFANTNTQTLVKVLATIDNPFASSIQANLDKVAMHQGKEQKHRDFYYEVLTSGKNLEDVFTVTLHDEATGEKTVKSMTREVLAKRFLLSCNAGEYEVKTVEYIPASNKAEGKKTRQAQEADSI